MKKKSKKKKQVEETELNLFYYRKNDRIKTEIPKKAEK